MSNWYGASDSPAPSAYLEWTDAAGNLNGLTFDVVLSEDWDAGATVTEHPVEVGADVADHVRVNLTKCELKIFASNEPIRMANSATTTGVTQANAMPTRSAVNLPVPTISWHAQPLTITAKTWNNPIQLRALAASAGGVAGSLAGGTTGGAIGAIGGSLIAGLLLQAQEQDVTLGTDAGLAPNDGNAQQPTFDVDVWANVTDYVAALHSLLIQLKNAATQFTVNGTKQQLSPMVIEGLQFHRDQATGSGESVTIGFKEVRVVSTLVVPAPIPNLSGGGGTAAASHGAQDPQPAPSQSVAYQGLSGVAAALLPPSVQAALGL